MNGYFILLLILLLLLIWYVNYSGSSTAASTSNTSPSGTSTTTANTPTTTGSTTASTSTGNTISTPITTVPSINCSDSTMQSKMIAFYNASTKGTFKMGINTITSISPTQCLVNMNYISQDPRYASGSGNATVTWAYDNTNGWSVVSIT